MDPAKYDTFLEVKISFPATYMTINNKTCI